jgi:dienelactone hydrolase
MRRCARDHVLNGNPGGEVVLIPWLNGYPLEGYFLPAAKGVGRAPVVVCMAEPGQRKEDYLFKAARYARDRGLSLLAVDLFGPDAGSRFDEVVGRRDLETSVGLVMDYLLERDDVDEERIAILSDQMQSSFVARGIAFDDRFAAAVCDGGLWDLNEREFLRERIAPDDGDIIVSPALSRVARNIKCPVLIPARRRGGLEPERVQELVGWMRAGGRDVTLEIFGDGETTAQGQADNPTLAGEFIFDWIEAQLAIVR